MAGEVQTFNFNPNDIADAIRAAQAPQQQTQQQAAQQPFLPGMAPQQVQPQVTPQAVAPVPAQDTAGLSIGQQQATQQVQPAQTQTQSQPLDLSLYTREVELTGDLSAQSRADLMAKHNLTANVIDIYVSGLKAQSELKAVQRKQVESEVFGAVGGEANYQAMIAWARTTLTPAEIQAYDQAVGSDNAALAKMAVNGVASRWRAEGSSQGLLAGTPFNAGAPPVGTFRSMAEAAKAINDPRYQTDPAYRDEVRARMAHMPM